MFGKERSRRKRKRTYQVHLRLVYWSLIGCKRVSGDNSRRDESGASQ